MKVTPIGRRFFRVAGSIVEQLETLATIARPNDRGEAGSLVVGFCTSLTAGNLPATLLGFKIRYPQVALAIMERSIAELVTALRNGGVDVRGDEFETLLTTKLRVGSDRPRIDRHDVSSGIIKSLISMMLGLGFVLESDIGANLSGLVYRDLQDGTGSSRVSLFAASREDNENPALANLLRLLFERYPFLPEG